MSAVSEATHRPMATDKDGQETLGVALIVASAVAFSTAGLFTRLIPVDTWTMLFWRGLFGGLTIAVYIVWRNGSATATAFKAIGGAGLLAGLCSTVATICWITALRRTTVAEVTIIYATAPFVAAAIAWQWLRERERWRSLVASLVALLGVSVMFGASFSAGHALGNLLGLVMTVLISLMMVIIRRYRGINMLPASCLSGFACAALVWPLSHPAFVSVGELSLLALFGITQFGLGLLLLTLGSRLISATRASLVSNLELPLGPLWVFIAFGELPTFWAAIGAVIVTAAIAFDMMGHKSAAASPPLRSEA